MHDHEPDARDRREGGFSLLEVVIAATILFTIIAIAGRFLRDSNNLLNTMSVRAEAEHKATLLADRIARSLRNGCYATVRPTMWDSALSYEGTPWPVYMEKYNWTNSTFYVRNVVESDGTTVLGDAVMYYHYWYEDQQNRSMSNGVDDDKDGKIDETFLWMNAIPASAFANNTDTTLSPSWSWWPFTYVADVSSYYSAPASVSSPNWNTWGVQFSMKGGAVYIKVSIPKYDPVSQTHLLVSAESMVKLRN